jgi:hypothetical protein
MEKSAPYQRLKSGGSAAKTKMTRSEFPHDECSKTKVRGVWIFPGNELIVSPALFHVGLFLYLIW